MVCKNGTGKCNDLSRKSGSTQIYEQGQYKGAFDIKSNPIRTNDDALFFRTSEEVDEYFKKGMISNFDREYYQYAKNKTGWFAKLSEFENAEDAREYIYNLPYKDRDEMFITLGWPEGNHYCENPGYFEKTGWGGVMNLVNKASIVFEDMQEKRSRLSGEKYIVQPQVRDLAKSMGVSKKDFDEIYMASLASINEARNDGRRTFDRTYDDGDEQMTYILYDAFKSLPYGHDSNQFSVYSDSEIYVNFGESRKLADNAPMRGVISFYKKPRELDIEWTADENGDIKSFQLVTPREDGTRNLKKDRQTASHLKLIQVQAYLKWLVNEKIDKSK